MIFETRAGTALNTVEAGGKLFGSTDHGKTVLLV